MFNKLASEPYPLAYYAKVLDLFQKNFISLCQVFSENVFKESIEMLTSRGQDNKLVSAIIYSVQL
jgi:hypothetical protein